MDQPLNKNINILLVDDDQSVNRSLCTLLSVDGYGVTAAGNGREALEALKDRPADLIISDIKMPDMSGLELLRRVKEEHSAIPVILITGFASIESAVSAMKEGAYDYISKPINDGELKIVIERFLGQRALVAENLRLKDKLALTEDERFLDITGKHPRMQKIYSLVEAVANTRATVLITGESGTGKRLIAHAVHDWDPVERAKPFVEVSCGALTETLLESELFGHVKGSFTGAIRDRMGRFELADKGTIFLDEIDSFTTALQVKLLRVLQEGEFERVGDTKTIKVDTRVIAATNHNLLDLIAQKKFRNDLYYRLNIINIEVPPLRERVSDIPLLARDLIAKHAKHLGKKTPVLSDDALDSLTRYLWPGNIRELENVIERAIILAKGETIGVTDLPDIVGNGKALAAAQKSAGPAGVKLRDAMKDPERELIKKALEEADWNRNLAAKKLGINRTTLYKKMVRFDMLKVKNNRG